MSSLALNEAETAAETLFAQSLQLFPPPQQGTIVDDSNDVHDPSNGLAARFRQVCNERLIDLTDAGRTQNVPDDVLKTWQLEQHTWDLVANLYLIRAYPQYEGPSPKTILAENPYTPEREIVECALDSSRLFRQLKVVREWLERSAPSPQTPENRKGYWRFTKLELVHQLRSKGPRGLTSTSRGQNFVPGLVQEMDPDAVSRSALVDSKKPAVLDPKDAEFEKTLSQSLYTHVRAGQIDRAMEICWSVDQPWRSAALRGAKAFSWKGISTVNDVKDADAMEEDSSSNSWSGNPRRRLWRKACQAGAMNPTLSKPSRLLLASLAPSLAILPTMTDGLSTWEDHMWARISALFEARLDVLLERYGSFWMGREITQGDQEDAETEDADEVEFEEEIERVLNELRTVKLTDKYDFSDRFHWVQYHMILNNTDEMFNQFAEEVQARRIDARLPDRHVYFQHVRFFAHLCLFLRHVGRGVPLEAAEVILQAYISMLEQQQRGDLVALYVGALGENAVDRYAAFLANLGLELTKHDRLVALNRAKEHGLDVEAVAFSTASLVAKVQLNELPCYTSQRPAPTEDNINITPAEVALCRSVEWLTFHEANHENALRQANSIVRYLLGFGRIHAARDLMLSLPAEVTSGAMDYPLEGPELVHFRHFFEVWDGFTAIAEVRAGEPTDPAQKMERLEWKKGYRTALDSLRETCERLFTSGWLAPPEEAAEDAEPGSTLSRRSNERARIRQLYIPELVFRLHHELFLSLPVLKESLKHIYRLTTIVADDRYGLYQDFMWTGAVTGGGKGEGVENRLPSYLAAVQVVGLAGLENGSKDPFAT